MLALVLKSVKERQKGPAKITMYTITFTTGQRLKYKIQLEAAAVLCE